MLRRIAWLGLVLFAATLAGCQSPVRLMPTPVIFSSGEVDPFTQAGSTAQGTDVPVLYVTNRGAVIEEPHPIYTFLPSERLRMGVAHVRIGDEALDWETLHRLSTSDDPEQRPIVQLDWLEPMAVLQAGEPASSPAARAFFAFVDKALAASPNRELVIYVHGSNNTVARGSAQAAQLRHFTGRRVVVVAFLWPSAGTILRYLTDVANAEASVEPFTRLVELLAAHTRASAIDVLAYSAGAQIVSPGLARLAAARSGEQGARLRKRLRNIYFAAPDIDTRRFVDELRVYIGMVERVSIAANYNDSTLRFAAWLHGASRAGRPNPTELDAEQTRLLVEASLNLGFDMIKVDPNDIPGLPLRSHKFWYDDPWVSSDLLGLLLLNASPPHRGLSEQSGRLGARYWTFPPDFYGRVARLFSGGASPAPAAATPGSRSPAQ
jgi:esterase/lipase superfamily enzyme